MMTLNTTAPRAYPRPCPKSAANEIRPTMRHQHEMRLDSRPPASPAKPTAPQRACVAAWAALPVNAVGLLAPPRAGRCAKSVLASPPTTAERAQAEAHLMPSQERSRQASGPGKHAGEATTAGRGCRLTSRRQWFGLLPGGAGDGGLAGEQPALDGAIEQHINDARAGGHPGKHGEEHVALEYR